MALFTIKLSIRFKLVLEPLFCIILRLIAVLPEDERKDGAIPVLVVVHAERLVLHTAVQTDIKDHVRHHYEQLHLEKNRAAPAAAYEQEERTMSARHEYLWMSR